MILELLNPITKKWFSQKGNEATGAAYVEVTNATITASISGAATADKQDEQTAILNTIASGTLPDKETPVMLYRVKAGQSFTGASAGDPVLGILVINTVTGTFVSNTPLWYNGNTKLPLVDANVDTSKLEVIAANSLTAAELSTMSLIIAQSGKNGTDNYSRPNDTAAYLAGDVIGTTTGSTAAREITGLGSANAQFRITRALIKTVAASIPSGLTTLTLYVFNATPPSALGDNAAYSGATGDAAVYQGKIQLETATKNASDYFFNESSDVTLDVKLSATGSLFLYVVTDGAYTPVANTLRYIQLSGVAL